jgi:hypothetical protein
MSRGPQSVRLLVGEDDTTVTEVTLTRVPGRGVNIVASTIMSGGHKPDDPRMRTFNVSPVDARHLAAALELLASSGEESRS